MQIVKKPKHISNIIVGPAYPLRGGIAAHNEALALHLNKHQHPSSLISYSLQYPNILFPGKTQYDENEIAKEKAQLEILTKVNSINPISWVQTARYINQIKPKLLILRFWMPYFGMALGTIAKLVNSKQTKIIGLVDNAIPHEKKPGDKILTKYFTKNCDAFMVMSKAVEEDLRKFESDKPIQFSPHPVYDHYGKLLKKNEACERLGIDANSKYILFFGMIRKYKGLDLLLKGFAQSKFKQQNVKLIIAGEYYEEEQQYLDLINELDIKDSVININQYIPNNEVANYFSAADLVAQTYHTATQSGITQIAYHFKKPMLVTNVGGLPEIVPHNKVGYVVDKEPKEVANAIDDFFINDRAKTFEKNIEEEAKKYAWSYFVEALINLYHKL